MYDREGEHLETGYRGSSLQTMRMGARKDGTLTAIDVKVIAELGNSTAHAGCGVPIWHDVHLPEPAYRDHWRIHEHRAVDAFRAPGFVEGFVGLKPRWRPCAQARHGLAGTAAA